MLPQQKKAVTQFFPFPNFFLFGWLSTLSY
jgi:hypothetical protein